MTPPKRILFRGVPMMEGWPQKIMAAQRIYSYTLEGRAAARIRYGDEHTDWGADRQTCHDCRLVKGEFHVTGGDVEQCPVCATQLVTCDCLFDDPFEDA